jgi:GH35 family endo-1,4-beta-xylanase
LTAGRFRAGIVVLILPAIALPVWSAEPAGKGKGGKYAVELTTQAVEDRIQKRRTAEVTVTVTDAAGKPLPHAAVTVEQVRHQFLFGCNAFAINTNDKGPLQQGYQQRFAALLNYATLGFYWGAYEPQEGKPAVERLTMMARWCAAHHIATKGHPLCWHTVPCKWLMGRSLEQIEAAQLGRITREVRQFAGLIDRWDVVNEAVVMPSHDPNTNPVSRLCNKLGNVGLIRKTFAAAAAASPNATLLLNDFDTSARYEKLIADCLAAGARIDVVGIQSHQHMGYWGDEKTWDVCTRFARFGRALHFTETTILSGDKKPNVDWSGRYDDWKTNPEGERRQAQQVTEFYTILFSHPAVEAITWWDFSDHAAWLGAPAGLVRADMSPKPAYQELMKLIKGKWWTARQTLATDAAGRVKFRGFLGEYKVQTSAGSAAMSIDKPSKAEKTVAVGGK